MANTFELIASATVGSGGASDITFNTILPNWTDLCVVISGRADNNAGQPWAGMRARLNGSSTGYSSKQIYGAGSGTPSSASGASTEFEFGSASSSSATASTFGNCSLYIPNYSGSTYKSMSGEGVQENNGTAALSVLGAGLWSNTAAVTSVTIFLQSSWNFVQYSTAYLYGVKNA